MATRERVQPEAGKLVDMAWDPITRIVGNLGIYTKIDFENQQVATCKSTSSMFRGFSSPVRYFSTVNPFGTRGHSFGIVGL